MCAYLCAYTIMDIVDIENILIIIRLYHGNMIARSVIIKLQLQRLLITLKMKYILYHFGIL